MEIENHVIIKEGYFVGESMLVARIEGASLFTEAEAKERVKGMENAYERELSPEILKALKERQNALFGVDFIGI